MKVNLELNEKGKAAEVERLSDNYYRRKSRGISVDDADFRKVVRTIYGRL